MTRTTHARIAGFTFLAYIAAGLTSMYLFGRAAAGTGVAEKLAGLATHAADAGPLVLLGFIQCLSAIVLGVTLFALTREEDHDVATMGLVCRVGEGIIGGLSIPVTLALFWLAQNRGTGSFDASATDTLAAYLLRNDVAVSATFFAVGSTAFCYLFLRGRMIPMPLAWLGVFASVILVILLPLQLAGWISGTIAMLMWLPMLAFEVPLGVFLLIKGVRTPSQPAHPESA